MPIYDLRYSDTVPIEVVALDHHVAKMHADAKLDLTLFGHPRPCSLASLAAAPRRAVSRSEYRATMTGVRQPPATMSPAGKIDAANLSARCDGRH